MDTDIIRGVTYIYTIIILAIAAIGCIVKVIERKIINNPNHKIHRYILYIVRNNQKIYRRVYIGMIIVTAVIILYFLYDEWVGLITFIKTL